jgi:hypothetical protein
VFQQRHGDGEEEQVDVEGDGGECYEEYTWAGQTRVRATTMLEGGFAGQYNYGNSIGQYTAILMVIV